MDAKPPMLRRVLLSAIAALTIGLGAVSVLAGFSASPPVRLLEGIAVFAAGAILIGGVVVLAMLHLAGWREPESEEEFEKIVVRAELLAEEGLWGDSDEGFDDDDEYAPIDDDEDFRRWSARRSTSCRWSFTARWSTSRWSSPTMAARGARGAGAGCTASTRVIRSRAITFTTGS